jgi:hypothetical protein
MMNDLVRVVSSPPHEAISTSEDIKNFRMNDFSRGATLYCVGHDASCRLSARGHLLSVLLCLSWLDVFC